MGDLAQAAYRDALLPPKIRADDLLSRTNVEEKAGLLFQTVVFPETDLEGTPLGGFSLPSTSDCIRRDQLNHFSILGPVHSPANFVCWVNKVQTLALKETRFGIPVTFSTDPRNHFTENVGTSADAGALSQWPETLGLAALRDIDLVRKFADIARQEYCALGIRCSLHPQIDLATEYRWSRINATFGEDADLSADMVEAYIQGFHGTNYGKNSVSTIAKHFPGGGAQGNDGEDSHCAYGADAEYPAGMLDYHLKPFERAIQAGIRQVMRVLQQTNRHRV
jgi:beta-glucosidase